MEPFESCLDEDLSEVIYSVMRESERSALVVKHTNDSEYGRCRKTLVGWIIEVCEAFGLSNITTFHTVHLMDRVFLCELLNKPSKRQSFQLIAMSCILVAAKFNETDEKLPSMEELNDMSRNSYTVEIFQKVEASVLNFLQWDIVAITPICYMRRFLAKTSTGSCDVDFEIKKTLVLLLGLALQDYTFTEFLPSMVCAAAVLCSRAIVRSCSAVDFEVWTSQIEAELQYTSDQLAHCCAFLYARFHEFTHKETAAAGKEAEMELESGLGTVEPPTPANHYTS